MLSSFSLLSVVCSSWKFQAVQLTKDPFQRLQQKLWLQTNFYFETFFRWNSPGCEFFVEKVSRRSIRSFPVKSGSEKPSTSAGRRWRRVRRHGGRLFWLPAFYLRRWRGCSQRRWCFLKPSYFWKSSEHSLLFKKLQMTRSLFLSKLTPCLLQLTFLAIFYDCLTQSTLGFLSSKAHWGAGISFVASTLSH